MSALVPGARVRCLRGPDAGPEFGWLGTVESLDIEEGLFVVSIVWDLLRGNRAERRKGGVLLHTWAFESESLALEYLEVIEGGRVH